MKKTLFFLVFLTSCLNSCIVATHRTIDHSIIIDKSTTFVLPVEYDGNLGTAKELRRLMIKEGFNCITVRDAENALKNRTPLKDSDINKDIEKAFNIKDINSIYVIKLSYNYFKNLGYYSFKNFTYYIEDFNSKKLIYWGKIDNSSGESEDILKALVKEIKSKRTY